MHNSDEILASQMQSVTPTQQPRPKEKKRKEKKRKDSAGSDDTASMINE
jgi:hypothetical protein